MLFGLIGHTAMAQSVQLRTVPANQIGSSTSESGGALQGACWRATEVAGKPTPAQDVNRGVHLLFETGGRLSRSDGSNRIAGSYELPGDVVRLSPGAATQKARIDFGDLDAAVRAALKGASRLTITCDRLNRLDASSKQLAIFIARTQQSQSSTSPGLAGTSWQLVKFQGSDEKILTPDEGAKYTIEFTAGQLTARIDCNRGRGTWKSGGSNQLQLGPLALTRAECPAGSLHDQIVKQWANIRSYVVKGGHLFLSLMADGGIYEFEPLKKPN
jgi:heat shock protein HslJ